MTSMIRLKHKFSFSGNIDNKYEDIQLTTSSEEEEGGGRILMAHRVILASVSTKLKTIFDENKNSKLIVIRNLRFEVLIMIVTFIYSGKVELKTRVDEEDFFNGLDMLLINFRVELIKPNNDEKSDKDDQTCHQKIRDTNLVNIVTNSFNKIDLNKKQKVLENKHEKLEIDEESINPSYPGNNCCSVFVKTPAAHSDIEKQSINEKTKEVKKLTLNRAFNDPKRIRIDQAAAKRMVTSALWVPGEAKIKPDI